MSRKLRISVAETDCRPHPMCDEWKHIREAVVDGAGAAVDSILILRDGIRFDPEHFDVTLRVTVEDQDE